jgi:outer membrane receptor for ferrienterochelin and colicins
MINFKKLYWVFLLVMCSTHIFAQNLLKVTIKDEKTDEILIGVSVFLKGTVNGTTSNDKGFAKLKNIPNGKQTIIFQSIGFNKKEVDFIFPKDSVITIFLESYTNALDEVIIVSSTRSSRNIENIPTRIETISGEELNEKAVMQPGNIKMLLTESTGIQTQQTSQVSGSASIRIQGLDGKYTQLLQDGFPLYSGFAGGLSILQIPPLNLKRAEVLKGSASTLYGGGAIAGLINLITKEPTPIRELSFLTNINQTQALDLSGFYAEKYKKTGLTIFASSNFQNAYDANNDGFSDIPKFDRYTVNPNFFYYPNAKTTFSFGINAGFEKRTGGDLQVLNGNTNAIHSFFETNNSNRYSTQAKFEKTLGNNNIFTLKNSVGYFNRQILRPTYQFEGQQISTFSEANYLIPNEKSEWILGASFVSDNFKHKNAGNNRLDYYNSAFGVFGQNNLKVSEKFIVESGLRVDISDKNNVFVLPRLSLLYKISSKLTSRIGGGLGYKNPTIFSEDAEERAFQNINPLDFTNAKPEKSFGLNADLNYKTIIFEEVSLSLNQLFFYTRINNPIILNQISNTSYTFLNANGNLNTKGFETNIKLRFEDVSAYIGYTYTNANRNFNNTITVNPLTAKSRLNANVMYDWMEKLRLAYEVFYVGQQYLTNKEKVGDYWVMGVSGEYKLYKDFNIFLNFENFLDSRQSRNEAMFSGSIQNPQFREVYTPTEGFIYNGGFKLNF